MEQQQLEQEIFKKFARHHPSKLKISSLRSTAPPKPDVEIDIEDDGSLAFEISELIDQDMIRRLQSGSNVNNLCRQYYEKLQLDKKQKFASKYGHSLIHIIFQNDISGIKKQRSIPIIFEFLLCLNPIEKEIIPSTLNVKRIIKKIFIGEGSFIGPVFGIDAGGGVGCPLLERIQEKFSNSYKTPHPCELLLYYDLQPEIISEFGIDDAYEYAQKNIYKSSFEKMWIYSLHRDKVLKQINRL